MRFPCTDFFSREPVYALGSAPVLTFRGYHSFVYGLRGFCL
nr:MAG TPA: hypothetical protein [Caudoviricetes sp.]